MPVDGYSGERSVLARFPSGQSAARAAGELREAGYHAVQVERISHYGSPAGGADVYPGGGEITGMTIFSSAEGASPYGGMTGTADGGGGEGDSFLVTVVGDEGSSGQVEEILERYGATFG
jgi:hypothetical protein